MMKMRTKWSELAYEYFLKSEEHYCKPFAMLSEFSFVLKMFLPLAQGSPVYTTWNPWLLLSTGMSLMSGGVAM